MSAWALKLAVAASDQAAKLWREDLLLCRGIPWPGGLLKDDLLKDDVKSLHDCTRPGELMSFRFVSVGRLRGSLPAMRVLQGASRNP